MYQIHCNREVSPLESHSILQRPFDLSLFLSFCKSSLNQFTPAAELLPVSGLEVAECRVLGSLFAQQDADVYHLTLTSAPGRGCLQALAQCLAVRLGAPGNPSPLPASSGGTSAGAVHRSALRQPSPQRRFDSSAAASDLRL